jgi:Purple acid Phosphatase, N-terminal domain
MVFMITGAVDVRLRTHRRCFSRDDLAIIRWTTNSPGGSDDHFAVIHYGTDPMKLSQTAKSHIRLNRGHPQTIFRVRLDGLKPQTTYYYTVTSVVQEVQQPHKLVRRHCEQ